MKAEQKSFSKFWVSNKQIVVEVQMTIQFELATEEDPDVGTFLSYEPKFPQGWNAQDELQQKLFIGVHAGLAVVDLPLPKTCLNFEISQLSVSPSLQEMAEEDIQRIGNLLLEMVRWAVAALWTGSHELRDSNWESSTAI